MWNGVREMFLCGALCAALSDRALAGSVWFVRASAPPGGNGHSFASAFDALDSAFAAATIGDEIRVATGTYVPSVPGGRASTFALKAGVALYGGFAGDNDAFSSRSPNSFPTVLSGDRFGDDDSFWINRDDNCQRVLTATDPGIGPATIVDGFTITGGNADGPVLTGAGAFISGCSPVFRDCVFVEHAAVSPSQDGSGGGVAIVNSSGSISVRFERCRFENCQATDGGAVSLSGAGARAEFVRCSLVRNVSGDGGAIHLSAGAGADLALCRALSNSAVNGDGGAFMVAGGSLRAASCDISWNTAVARGGALSASCCDGAQLTGCTMTGNYAGLRTGGVRIGSGAHGALHNCILFENSDMFGLDESAQVSLEDSSASADIRNCLVGGWTGSLGGPGNSDGTPGFSDPPGPDAEFGTEDDDLRLTAGSVCVDSGDDALVPADWADADSDGDRLELMSWDRLGFPRTSDGDHNSESRTDRGAYEYRCPADFDLNDFVSGDDFDAFVIPFEAGDPAADFDSNGFVNGDDFDAFVDHFVAGC